MIAIDELRHAFKLIRKNKLSLLMCSILEMFFFILYGFATAPIYMKLTQYTLIIGSMASEALSAALREQKSLSAVLLQPPISPYLLDVFLLLLLLAATTFILYILIQGFIWKTILNITGKKYKYIDYLKKFIILNLFWFLFFMIYYLAGFVINVRAVTIRTLTETTPSGFPVFITSLFMFIIVYFAVISYTKLNLRKSFSTGIKKIKYLLPMWLILGLYALFLHFVLDPIMKLGTSGLIIGIIILFPSLIIGRLYISLVVQKIK